MKNYPVSSNTIVDYTTLQIMSSSNYVFFKLIRLIEGGLAPNSRVLIESLLASEDCWENYLGLVL
jgi:hypothetical protein